MRRVRHLDFICDSFSHGIRVMRAEQEMGIAEVNNFFLCIHLYFFFFYFIIYSVSTGSASPGAFYQPFRNVVRIDLIFVFRDLQ